MKLTVLDLEMNQPSGRIIQIGAVVGDTTNGEILERYRAYVNPNETLSPQITDLTGITERHIKENGVSLVEAYQGLRQIHLRYTCFINPVTWGGGDSKELFDQLSENDRGDWCFGRRWIDAKTIHVSKMVANDKVLSGGLSTSMKTYNMKFNGRKHDAQDDAENTWKIYYHMLYLMRHNSF